MKRFFFELLKVVIFILIFCKGVGLLFGKECVGESKKVKCGRKNKSVIKNLSLSSEMVLDQGKVSPLSSNSEQSRSLKM